MKTSSLLLTAAFLSLTSAGFSFDLPGMSKIPGDSSLPGISFPRLAGSGTPASAAALDEKLLEALRAEALENPGKFIDEHSPSEVGAAFGLPANSEESAAYGFAGSRYVVNNAAAQRAVIKVRVNLTTQRLTVEGPELKQEFKISSGLAPEHGTPGSGKCFAPDFIEAMHYSSLYNKAPMPNSIFFNGNIAIHGTEAEKLLGKPASHGCIRLSKADAKTLYEVVKANGKSNASICVEGKTPVN